MKSRLGRSLVQLHDQLQEIRQEEVRGEDLFVQWQARWANDRHEIARRLKIIDAHLQELSQSSTTPPDPTTAAPVPPAGPHFSLVGLPHDAREMTSMGQQRK